MTAVLRKMLGTAEVGSFAALAALVVLFSLLSPQFLTLESWGALVGSSTEVGVIAIGMTFLLIIGEIDLSVGAIFAVAGVSYAHLVLQWQMSPALALPLCVCAGAFMGAINGWLTVKTGLPSFIVTLGSMMFWQGSLLVFTSGFPISDLDGKSGLHWLSTDLAYGFRTSFLIWLALGVGCSVVLTRSKFGNWIMATGGNERAAFAMGIPTSGVKILCFAATGALCAIAALIQFAQLESISPVSGEQYALKAIAIAVMGGTALSGGTGTVIGSMFGTLIMGVLTTGLVQAGLSNYWFRAVVGVIVIVAVLINGRTLKLLKVQA